MSELHREGKAKRLLRCLTFLISCLLVLLIAGAIVLGLRVENFKIPGEFGNRADNIACVQERTDANDFSFVVAGDIRGGMPTFKSMLDAAEKEKPAFVVILGDLIVRVNDISFKNFAYQLRGYCQKMPMFVVVGNHDFDPDRGVGIESFEKFYGPCQFSFRIGENLFIFLNDNYPYCESGEYVDFLESAILKEQGKIKKTFVFTHVPVMTIDGSLTNNGMTASGRFMELAKKYNIDYVFSGHVHGYIRQQKDNTVYIVSGGGGSRLHDVQGKFHHLVRISVKDGQVTELVIKGAEYPERAGLIERKLVEYVWPRITKNIFTIVITGIIIILGVIEVVLQVVIFRKNRQRI
jgi:predicted phosphodiesterase